MAHVSSSILFVNADALASFPKPVQDFVNKYFKITKISRVEWFYAFRELDGRKDLYLGNKGEIKKGIAPSHTLHLNAKVDGDVTLYDWFQNMLQDENEERIFELTEFWEDNHYVEYD